jgi:molecular chaperone HtpG
LYLTDPVDEILVQVLTDFQDKKLQSAAKGEVDLGSEEERQEKKKELDEKAKDFGPLMQKLQELLDDRVKEVRLSTRLTDSPACLVGGEEDVSPRLEKLLRQQGDIPPQRRILELNPAHDVVTALKARYDVNENSESVPEYAELLYGYALLAEGTELPDPAKFATRFAELMRRGLGVSGGD